MTTRLAPHTLVAFTCVGALVSLTACVQEGDDANTLLDGGLTYYGDGDGDADETDGDGDGDPAGDGDGDPDPTGDGDPDPTGDGDPDPTGDGDGDPTGDGDGDTSPCAVPDPGWGGSAQVGGPAPHFSGFNQLGEEVSICEYEGLPIAIDTSAVWCGPCQLMSQCLGGNDNACLQVFGGNQQAVDVLIHPMVAEINANTFAWVTVLTENVNNGPPAMSDAIAWDQNYPVDNVWVIPDVQQKYYGHLPIESFPSIWLINPEMNWQDLNQMTVFNTIINLYL
ncbi:TlpA family protein disulfide reductase [Enhygromyxa salina]|uniref:Uncharacterized protein n=1 Tax=Enhygromyxa salina TaxID=215803 RepID=A0A2S9XLD0_9BACT|nr:hypothetical protein [Enhygromyxa salina]PRP93652.1 hypothetical protein ENSA7_80800 [Enhygromyxa salina]